MNISRFAAGALFIAVFGLSLHGQTPEKNPIDPTQPSQKLREILSTPNKESPRTGPVMPKLPTITVKGRAVARDGNALAMLSVDGKIYFVSKGSFLTSNNLILQVADVTDSAVRIKVQPNNIELTIR
ncbi:MAG: hypothetical protein AB7K24_07525 [Gemmataceae bacterium]